MNPKSKKNKAFRHQTHTGSQTEGHITGLISPIGIKLAQ